MESKKDFFCYSLKLFHFISAFGIKCITSNINSGSGRRYWIFEKSERLDKIIAFYNEVKHKFD